MLSKKTFIISLSALICALAVLITVLLVIPSTKKEKEINNSVSDSASGDNSSLLSTTDEESKEEEEIISAPEVPEEPEEIELHISSATSNYINTTENQFTFTGTCDPEKPLKLNGKKIQQDEKGIFSVTVDLKVGKNVFTFSHKGKKEVYTIDYRYVIIKSYSPSADRSYSSGSTLSVSAVARKGSSVTATLNGKTITLTEHNPQQEDTQTSNTFVTYKGSFKLPSNNKSDLNLGKIKFSATCGGKTETFYSGKIKVNKPKIKVNYNSNAAPLGGKYINVGTGKITEIIAYEAETFDAYSTNDWSKPTNNYLPKGTVDYSAQGHIYYEGSEKKEYSLLRCGRQVYTTRKDKPTDKVIKVVKEYSGTLPDHNEIKISSFKNNGSHTVLTLDTLWKAPFYFDILPQTFENPKTQNYKVSNVTYQYVDITLCYTTVFKGKINIPKNNPLFSSAKIIKNRSDYTIRLYLKTQGGFYGWDANYNKAGQLVFEFLNPAYCKDANNAYGTDLSGVKILIDVGHGGTDPGAPGFDSKRHNEAIQNLFLAKKIKAELEKTGAKVYMNRTTGDTVTNDRKIQKLKNTKPDLCIAIHHNSAYSSSANGFDSYYSHPFAKKAAELVAKHTRNTGIYKKYGVGWHYYYMARSSYCPVVLTENGFMSNYYDYKNIISSAKNAAKAKAIVRGIVDYFRYISPDEPYYADDSSENNNSSSKPNSSSQNSSTDNSSDNKNNSSNKNNNSSENKKPLEDNDNTSSENQNTSSNDNTSSENQNSSSSSSSSEDKKPSSSNTDSSENSSANSSTSSESTSSESSSSSDNSSSENNSSSDGSESNSSENQSSSDVSSSENQNSSENTDMNSSENQNNLNSGSLSNNNSVLP